MGTIDMELVCELRRGGLATKVTDGHSSSQTALSDHLHGVHRFLPMGESDSGSIPLDGPRYAVHHLPNDLHLDTTFAEQGVEYCTILARQAGPQHDYTNDGSHLPRVLSLLCVNQHRGNETFHFSGLERTVPHPDDNCT